MDASVVAAHQEAARAAGLTQITPEFLQRLSAAWSEETALKSHEWSKDRPEAGQCAITAALIHEELGIPMVRGQAFLPDGRIDSYYWNEGLHTTFSQYPEGTTFEARDTGPQGQAAFDYVMGNPDTAKRYAVLKQRYLASAGAGARPVIDEKPQAISRNSWHYRHYIRMTAEPEDTPSRGDYWGSVTLGVLMQVLSLAVILAGLFLIVEACDLLSEDLTGMAVSIGGVAISAIGVGTILLTKTTSLFDGLASRLKRALRSDQPITFKD